MDGLDNPVKLNLLLSYAQAWLHQEQNELDRHDLQSASCLQYSLANLNNAYLCIRFQILQSQKDPK